MLPYSVWLLIIGLCLTFGWVYLDLPLGPDAGVGFSLPPEGG
jgi:aminobenzoyl-glutamate transport protein